MFYVEREAREGIARGRRGPFKMPCRICQREINSASRRPRQDMLDKIKAEAGCADCGHRDDAHPEVFDFDHLPGVVKTKGVATFLTSGTVEAMLAEVAKCEVVCANCHRIRTRQRGSRRFGVDKGRQQVPVVRHK